MDRRQKVPRPGNRITSGHRPYGFFGPLGALAPRPQAGTLALAFLMASMVTGGCDWGAGPPPIPVSLEAVAGAGQEATVGKPVPVSPAVRVLNRKGKPMRGQDVLFSVVSGAGQLSAHERVTDEDGIARVGAWILGPKAGQQALQAQVANLPPVFFTANGVADDPATVVIQSGDGQTGTVGSPLELKPRVLLRDAYQNLVEGARVQFLVSEGGGYLSVSTAETNSSGVAEAGSWTLGTTPGTNTLMATVSNLPPVTFTATGVPDAPNQITVLLGDGQTGRVGTALPLRPTLLLADRFGNFLEGIQVIFEASEGSGTVSEPRQVSGSTGVVVSGPWTLGTAAGVQSLRILISGVEPLTLLATAEPGPPASALAQGSGLQSATVGMQVPEPPRVQVGDAFGNPVPGVAVTFSASGSPDPEASPGTVDGPDAVTDESGVAAANGWTLGILAGSYSVEAQVQGLPDPVIFFANATAGPASIVDVGSGDNQTAQFGSAVPVSPSVRVEDQFGNGVAQVPVSFQIVEGGGSLVGAQVLTDGVGVASVESWTLGPTPGVNRVEASVDAVGTVTFRAVGLAALPAALAKVAGDNQVAQVGSDVPVAPRVRVTDAGGNPVALVPVLFMVPPGGGSVTPLEVSTDSQGFASVGAWTLGTTSGQNALSASVSGLQPVVFSATGIPGPPAAMALGPGDNQTALVNTPVPLPPSVVLRDTYGNSTPGVTVTFSVTAGGGTATGGVATTDGTGVARVGAWILGPTAGINQLKVYLPGVQDVSFFAQGKDPGGFQVELDYRTSVDPSIAPVFADAADRWEGIIVGDIPDFPGTLPAGGCQPVTEAGGIDDVKIYVTVRAIDGSGGVLGRAGPCYYRTIGGAFPITGIMELDEADLLDLQAAGLLEDVIVHEMGHILGFGTLWNATSNDFLVGGGTADPHFNGAAATWAFDVAGGWLRTAPKVPVENTGGAGTRDGHWRESVHDAELMTGWIEGGGVINPLSAITIGSFSDMGYAVDMTAADPYLLFNPLGAPGKDPVKVRIYIEELPPPIPIPVGSGGGL